jgi:microsomal dipeptidase-like Zn-dependent dipeptidase
MNRSTVVAVLAVLSFTSCPPHNVPTPNPVPPQPVAAAPLTGFVDLHTHPMANLGFSGKLLWGGVDWQADGGALMPVFPDCTPDQRATNIDQALGNDACTHGDFTQAHCGDWIRSQVITTVQQLNNANNPPGSAIGAPTFMQWPMHNDVTHQVMWADSLSRAYDAGMRVMVALAVNNKTLADTVAGPHDGPDDDQSSADLQVDEMKLFVDRHSDFMQVARSSNELHDIVAANKLAVVLGVEIDDIGDFNTVSNLTHDDIRDEIARLRSKGVRYVFPIHLIDNPFGTTAPTRDIFNLSNLREAGHFWNLQCANPADGINYRPTMQNPMRDPFQSTQQFEMALLMLVKLHLINFDDMLGPPCPMDGGVVNRGAPDPGLTPDGVFAVQELMRQCMLIDVDHQSMAAANDTLGIALDAGYPVNSGHNNVRSQAREHTERQLTEAQYGTIGQLHGLAGVGSANTDEVQWVAQAQAVLAALGDGGVIGFGTDSNGVSPLMVAPPPGAPPVIYSATYPKSAVGPISWDYNDAGVAHYGMLSDFLQGVRQVDGGAEIVANMMHGAQAFHDAWARAENYCLAQLPPDAGMLPMARVRPLPAAMECPEGSHYRVACGRCLKPRESCPACDGDAGTCLPLAPCPKGRARNAFGVCSEKSDVELPKLSRNGPSGVTVTPGKYVLKLQDSAFTIDLQAAPAPWTLRGKKSSVPAKGGFTGAMWVLQLTSGPRTLLLIARPEKGAPLHGGFALHTPGGATVTGPFTLEPATAALLKTAKPVDDLASYLETLH